MADTDSEDEKLNFVAPTKGADSPHIEEDADDEEDALQINEIRYLIEGSREPEQVGPISYAELKRHYNDPRVRCDKLTHIWNGLEVWRCRCTHYIPALKD